MRRAATRSGAAGALALALLIAAPAACSDDGEPAADQGQAAEAGPIADAAAGADQAPPAADHGPASEGAPTADQGGAADGGGPKNTGALCSASAPCADSRETCLYFGGAQGMCLAPCNQQGDPCPVLNKTTQLATCSIKGLDPSKWFCGYLCAVGGKSYACPNASDYACVPASNPSFSFCEPK